MEENKKKTNSPEVIDLRVVFRKIWSNRKLFYKILPIVFVLSCIYIFSLPRYYISDIKLAPEMENSATGGTLGALASSFGFDLSEMQSSDAITPLLYPDLMEDNGFVSGLMNIHVKSQDGEINTTYHDYLKLHQKTAWWNYPIIWIKGLLPKKEDEGSMGDGTYDPYNLSKNEDAILNKARSNIGIAIDKKTGVISISVESQDPLICKTLADSVKEKLQMFITEYRTNKARTDYEYYKKLAADAKQDYEKTRRYYASMADASTNVRLKSVELKIEDIENDMQLKLNAYTTLNTQLQAAKAKVQEKTPAFTLLKGASVPIKPAGPKRMIFVAGMLILALLCTSVYSIKNYIFSE
jgi:hypothetical protein